MSPMKESEEILNKNIETNPFHDRILNNDFGIPQTDLTPLLTHDDSYKAYEEHLGTDFFGDRGVEPAMRIRKGGRMQSQGRAWWKTSAEGGPSSAVGSAPVSCTCTKRRVHPHYMVGAEHCNQSCAVSEQRSACFYDKLPAYCTLLSRPVHGIVRNVRLLPSELELQDDQPDDRRNNSLPVFDKIPAYQTCFANSTKYDKGSDYKITFTCGEDDASCHEGGALKKQKLVNSSEEPICHPQNLSDPFANPLSEHSVLSNHPGISPNTRSPTYGSRFRVRFRGCARKNSFHPLHHSHEHANSVTTSTSNTTTTTTNNNNTHNNNISDSDKFSKEFSRLQNCAADISENHPKNLPRQSTVLFIHTPSHAPSDSLANRRNKSMPCALPSTDPLKERRIVYVGRIPREMRSDQLRSIFEQHGKVLKCTLHFRQLGDNYGFVKFALSRDAIQAVEQVPRRKGCEDWDVCFGGRRNFCDSEYLDLDGSKEVLEEYDSSDRSRHSSFDELLKEAIKRRS